MPTIKTSEFTVLQIVGLDAAVVCLSFLPSTSLILTGQSVIEFFQNVILFVYSMLLLCHYDPYAA